MIKERSQHAGSSTFAARTSQRTTKSCKRALTLPNAEKEKSQWLTLCISNSGFSANFKRKTINQRSELSDSLVS